MPQRRVSLLSLIRVMAFVFCMAVSPAFAQDLPAQIDAIKQAMMGDPAQALELAQRAELAAKDLPKGEESGTQLATTQWLKAEALLRLNRFDEAAPAITNALDVVVENAPSSKLHGDILRAKGALSAMTGDVETALADFLSANDIFLEADQPRSRAMILQDIGQIYFDAGDFERVLYYYNEAADAFTQDPWINLSNYNNRAQVYHEQQKFGLAIVQYELALGTAKDMQSAFLEARINTNLAATHVLAGNLNKADAAIASARRLALREDAAGLKPFIDGVDASVKVERGDDAAAAALLDGVFKGQALSETPLPYRDFHELGSQVYERLGREPLALAHFKAFHRLEAEANSLTASASAQLMSAQFNFANQNLKISNLRQGQLERDVLIEKQRADFQFKVFAGIAAATAVIFGLLLFGYISIKKSRDEVRVANDTLSETNTALGKALKAKTEFLATTSHEIRTPLNGILGMTQVLLADQRLAVDTKSRLQVVQGAGEAMKLLVDDILDVAKMETGDVSIDASDTDLKALVSNITKLWKSNAEAKSLAFHACLDDLPVTVLTDGPKLQQVLSNLLSNAVKFTREGHVRVSAVFDSAGADQNLVFKIADSGIGIAPEDQERIFESFTQANSSTTREFAGTGLGLAISKKLAEALGGILSLESALGEGSTFTLTLPLKAVSSQRFSYDASVKETADTLKAASLLVINANVAMHAKMRALFAPSVRTVAFAASLEQAVSDLDEGQWDHILAEADAIIAGESEPALALERGLNQLEGKASTITLLAKPSDALSQADLEALSDVQLVLKPIGAQKLIAALQSAYAADTQIAA